MLLSGAIFSPQVWAHKLSVFAYAEGNEVYVEGYFADGKKAQNSKVEVFNPAGALLNEGITGDEGEYRFSVSAPDDLRIVLNAGMGHQGEYLLPANELAGGAASEDVAVPVEESAPVEQKVETSHVAPSAGKPTDTQLEAAVRKAVSEAIRPLVRELDETRQKARVTDMVGAIGYIFGVMGLFFFFKARQSMATKK